MKKVALNSSVGYQLEVIQVLDCVSGGLAATEIAERINLSVNQVRKITDDMMQLKLIESRRQPNNSGRRGNKKKGFFITDAIRNLMDSAESSFKGKKRVETPSKRTKRGKKKRARHNKSNSPKT